MNNTDSSQLERLLRQELYRLRKGDGVRRLNLAEWVHQTAHRFLEINPCATYESNLKAVSKRLLELIERLPNENLKRVARYSFNLADDPNTHAFKLVERQEKLAAIGGPGRSKCNKLMWTVIIPELVRMMLADQL